MDSLFTQEEIIGKSTEELYPWMKNKKFICILDPVEVKEMVDRAIKAGMCVIDTETSGLDTRVYDGKCNTFIAGICTQAASEAFRHINMDFLFANISG